MNKTIESEVINVSILIYDDNIENLQIMEKTLGNAGYDVITSTDVIESIRRIEKNHNDIELLITKYDVEPFGLKDYLHILRKLNKDIKVVVLASSNDHKDELLSIELDVDEYIKKPVVSTVFAKKLEKVLNYNSTFNDNLFIKRDMIEIDILRGLVFKNSEQVSLTLKEYQILVYLVKKSNNVVSREELYTSIWGNNKSSTNFRTIDVHISNLRQKLDLISLISIRGEGYRLEN